MLNGQKFALAFLLAALISPFGYAAEYHVAITGSDENEGTIASPLRTIMAAAEQAQPGDTIIVHEGVYRERINPPRGGVSDEERITYLAAPGQQVIIKGSEPVSDWEHVQHDTWKTRIPNDFFGSFNPYSDEIQGDWFNPHGRKHHTGAVYLDDHWLTEAATQEEVLEPVGDTPYWWQAQSPQGNLFNVAWFQPHSEHEGGARVPATSFAAQQGTQNAPSSEGGECIGWIEHGDWARYEEVDFGPDTQQIEIRAASATQGGIIEIRLDAVDGELLGTAAISNTGDWQTWESFKVAVPPIRGAQIVYLVFKNPRPEIEKSAFAASDLGLWFAQVDDSDTTIWAQFKDTNPNEAAVEINVRQSVFYPEEPGINYLTVRGFTMMHAATPWAPPTSEQIGLIGTHWSKGWIIEDNDIRYSTCVGITLGKYGDEWDNTSQDTAEGYVKTIHRALENGWSKDTIGHHIVRNNRIAHCEQAGIVGSLGPIFSQITNNAIHDIHVRQLFGGHEMAGIKLHAPIDTLIRNNHIYRTCRGIWLDWMTQGARVTGNLLHDNGPREDLFVEVNHGPYVIDNNLFLSERALADWSHGGAFAHNLFAGWVWIMPVPDRATPFHKPHSTELAGLRNIDCGDNRFYNNVFAGSTGLSPYNDAAFPVFMAGNVFLNGAQPSVHEEDPIVAPEWDPLVSIEQDEESVRLKIQIEPSALEGKNMLVTTDRLGKAVVPDLPFVDFDGSPLTIDTDFFGAPRDEDNPVAGPFETQGGDLVLELRRSTER